MLLPEFCQAAEGFPGFLFFSQRAESQSLVVDVVGRLVVVIPYRFGNPGSGGCLFEEFPGRSLITHGAPGTAHHIICPVIRNIVQFSLSQVFRIGNGPLRICKGILRLSVRHGLLRKGKQRRLVFIRDLAFPAFPYMEGVVFQQVQCLFILPVLVQQRYIRQHQRAAVRDDFPVRFQDGQPVRCRAVQPFQQLVLLQQAAAVFRLQPYRLRDFPFRQAPVAVVVIRNGQVPVGRRQAGLFLHGRLPVAYRGVILLFVIQQLAQVVMGFRRGIQDGYGVFQHGLFLRPVREAEIRRQGFRFFRVRLRGVLLSQLPFRKGFGVVFHRRLRRALCQQVCSVLRESESY